jgi:uncharacterized membrane protein YfcA
MAILFFLGAYFAEILGTVAGFGSSTVFLPLALLFFDFKTALVLVAIFHIFGNIGRLSFFRHGLDKRMLFIFGIPSVILTLIGALLVSHIPQDTLKAILGMFLVVYGLIALGKKDLQLTPSLQNALVGGGLSGFLAGLIGTGGALRGAFLTAFGLPKETYIATAAVIALAVDITRIPVYLAEGFLNRQLYWYLPLLLVIALAGSFTGREIVKQMPQKTFKNMVLIAIVIVGLTFIYNWFQS